ncbi:bifunctional 5,10-methylenetetrahydrofolate dehydrogenase/5,10-methenyltetrahydrofolate cyclohydrolase [Candidatus Parcubacteria bacterium]|nr:bifunctional 5,10-methylenetetrahydrofolate dehydrogenase/5,10-methenyltetrahydrofolate cyclohydrolase [Candidatus Parcubacteria bacterium]
MTKKTTNIINGKLIAEKIKDKVAKEIFELRDNKRPNLAIILVGDRDDSKLYVDLKEKEAKKVGIDTHIYRCADNTHEPEIFSMIDYLNKDKAIDAILVQLPLPKNYDTDGIILAIDPRKDVDRFHPDNLEKLLSACNHNKVMPPVFKVVLEILKEIKFDIKNTKCLLGKKVCVLANSDIFGKSLVNVLSCFGAKAQTHKPDEKKLSEKTQKADVLITAVGKAQFIKKDMIKKDAVIIDIGISREDGKVYGDVDFDDVKETAGFITPVPGGVGPITIAMLFENVLELYKRVK